MAAKYSVPVLTKEGKTLNPTTPAKARKLMRTGRVIPCWSSFGTFYIQLKEDSRADVTPAYIGVDPGSAYDGYVVVSNGKTLLGLTIALPKAERLIVKLRRRKRARLKRLVGKRSRRPGRRRFNRTNTVRQQSTRVREKILSELFRLYPVEGIVCERSECEYVRPHTDVVVSYASRRNIKVREYSSNATASFREKYGFYKSRTKGAISFTAHCSDALALVSEHVGKKCSPNGEFVHIDDSYRPLSRRPYPYAERSVIHRDQGGVVSGLQKRGIVGLRCGIKGRLCGHFGALVKITLSYGRTKWAFFSDVVWFSRKPLKGELKDSSGKFSKKHTRALASYYKEYGNDFVRGLGKTFGSMGGPGVVYP